MEMIKTKFEIVGVNGDPQVIFTRPVELGKEIAECKAYDEVFGHLDYIKWEHDKGWGYYMTAHQFEDLVSSDEQMDLPYEGA